MTHRFDQMEAQLHTLIADVRRDLEQPEQLPTYRFDQLDVRLEQLLAELQRARASALPQERPPTPAPRARMAPSASASTPPKPTAKKRSKRKTKARNLPRTLMPLSTFRQVHGVSEKAVENAIQRGKLAAVRGAWFYNNRHITTALDRQGEQQFYALFLHRESFQLCKDCPHAL